MSNLQSNPFDGLLTKAEIAQAAGRTERTIENWMAAGLIPFIRLGRSVYFDPTKVRKAIESQEVRPRRRRG